MKTVARLLDTSHLARRGRFSDTTVRRLIRDRSALGTIVSEDIWQRCQVILDEREKGGPRPTRKPVQLFGGKACCGCGGVMRVRAGPSTAKIVCRRCRAKVDLETLEGLFIRQLDRVPFEPEEILAAFAEDRAAQGALAQALRGGPVAASAVWGSLTAGERVELVDSLVSRLVVGSGEVAFEYAVFQGIPRGGDEGSGQHVAISALSDPVGNTAPCLGNESVLSGAVDSESPGVVTPGPNSSVARASAEMPYPHKHGRSARASLASPPLQSNHPPQPERPAVMGPVAAPEPGLPELVTVEELARRWHLKPDTIRAWARRRQIPSRKLGRLTVFELRALEAWFQTLPGAQTPASESATIPEDEARAGTE